MSSRRSTKPRAIRVYATSVRRDPVDQRRLARALLAVALAITEEQTNKTPPTTRQEDTE